MANVYDLKSVNVVIGSAVTSFGIGAVPAGKQRFITFVKAVNLFHLGGATNTLYLATNTASTVALATAVANKKLTVPFRIGEFDDVRQIPEGKPDMQNPLFSIDEGKYLVGSTSQDIIDVFVQYYDD